MTINQITGQVVDAAMRVHSALGPGMMESVYEMSLAYELRDRRLRVSRQIAVPVSYRGIRIEVGYRLDLLVNDAVVVELKAATKVMPVHKAQLLSYLRLSGYRVGLLINFHVEHLTDRIMRLVNKL